MGRGGASTKLGGGASADRFYWSTQEEPHVARRKAILKKHPEVNKLMGPEPRTKWIVAALVAMQVSLAVMLRGASWPVYIATTYVVGATITHALFLAIHELAHNLGAKRPETNRLIAMVANLPIVFPYCVTFKQYHIEHHKQQGVDGVDTDVPARLEARLFQGRLGKTVWCISQILFYALRPMLIKAQTPTAMHALNFAVQVRRAARARRQAVCCGLVVDRTQRAACTRAASGPPLSGARSRPARAPPAVSALGSARHGGSSPSTRLSSTSSAGRRSRTWSLACFSPAACTRPPVRAARCHEPASPLDVSPAQPHGRHAPP